MSSRTTQWILELIDNITAPLRSVQGAADAAADAVENIDENLDRVNESGSRLPELGAQIGATAFAFNQVSDAVGKFNQKFQETIAPGISFDSQMAEVSAITGQVGDDLNKLGDRARGLAKEFGGDASAQLESFKGIIGKFGPDIAESDEAMEGMGRNVAVLSKLMGGDSVASMDALTTSMLQYGVDLSDPIGATAEMTRMMNVMVAAGNEGSSEVSDTAAALKQAGLSAKNANVEFEEVNAALQALATGSLIGSEAGVGLRNVLLKMAGEDVIPKHAREKMTALGVDFKKVSDTTVPFTERLRELKKVQADATLTSEIFGIANVNAATVLFDTIDMQDELKGKITGTNAAMEGANIIMDTYAEKQARAEAKVNDLKISLFNVVEPIAPFISLTGEAMGNVTDMGMAVWGLSILLKKDLYVGIASSVKSIYSFVATSVVGKISAISFSTIVGGAFTTVSGVVSTACGAISTAIMSIPIIGWIAAIIAAIAGIIIYLYNASAETRGILFGIWEVIKVTFTGYYQFIYEVMAAILHVIKGVFNPANWFDDDYHFSDALDRVVNAAKTYGENVGNAFSEGKAKGMADYAESHPEEEKKPSEPSEPSVGKIDLKGEEKKTLSSVNKTLSTTKTDSSGGKKGSGKSLNLSGGNGSGSNGSGGKSITMNVTMNIVNHGVKNVDEFTEQVVRKINDRLNDALAVAG